MPVVIADLSNGLEGKRLPVVVDNFNFEYICGGLEIGPELNGLFAKNESTTNGRNEQHQGTAQMPPPLLSANLDFEVFNAGGGKGWGLRTVQQIDQPNLALFEYGGVLKLADGNDDAIVEDDYIFEFEYNDHHFFVDANAKGNLARFCNHSCEPNCYARLAMFGNENGNAALPRLLVCTKRQIQKGEELTLDYGQGWWEAKSALNCACGTENCKFNGKPGEDVRMLEEEEEREMPIRQTATKCGAARAPYAAAVGFGRPPKEKLTAKKRIDGQPKARCRQTARKACPPIIFSPSNDNGNEDDEDELPME